MVWLANEVQQLGGTRRASKTIKSGHLGLITHFLARYQSVNMDIAHVTPDVAHVTPDVTHVTPDVTHNMSYVTAKKSVCHLIQ